MATFVLVHGAYQGGWIWKPVVDRLRAVGHQVYAPSLDGCAERHHLVRPGITVATHAQEIAQLMFYEDLRDVVLVGTSSGGMVICKAAELARERIARLVFVDALALMTGERVGDIVKRVSANETTTITTSRRVPTSRLASSGISSPTFGCGPAPAAHRIRSRRSRHRSSSAASGHRAGRRRSSAAVAPRTRPRRTSAARPSA